MTPNELLILRRNSRLTQIELAKRLGIARQTVNRWELGKREIPSDTIPNIVMACIEPAAPPVTSAERKTAKAWLDAYRKARHDGLSHQFIARMWAEHNTVVPEIAQQMISEAFPDILNNGETE